MPDQDTCGLIALKSLSILELAPPIIPKLRITASTVLSSDMKSSKE
jgi:hypothetical protein